MNNGSTDPFAEACGITGPLRVELEGPGLGDRSSLEFRQPFLVVGRDPVADLVIDDPEVGPRHAFLQVIAGRVFCLNIGSRSGIHWEEGPRLASWVDTGTGIRIGPVRIRFGALELEQGGSLPISEEFDWPSPTEARLEFLGDESSRKPWPITRALSLLGSSPTCRVHLPGPGIGRMHAALVRTPTGVWLVDLLGPGGMMVRGVQTRYAQLEDGDEIVIGPHRMKYMIGPVEQPTDNFKLARRQPERITQPARRMVETKTSLVADVPVTAVAHASLPIALDPATTNKLLEEFDRMHQRTVDQFQQAMMMMFRMHQDQMDSVREELARLDRLEAEQKEIRAELARKNSPPPSRVGIRLDTLETTRATTRPKTRLVDEAEREPVEKPHRKPSPAPAQEPWNPRQPASAMVGHPSASSSFEPHPDPHDRLARRIAEIQEERQGLWKRIMASLSGDASVKRIP